MFRGPHSHKSMKKSQSAQTTYFLSYYSDNILSFPLRYSYSMWCTYVHVPNNMSPVSAPCQLRVSSHKESVMYSMYRGVNTAQNPIVKHRQSIRAR